MGNSKRTVFALVIFFAAVCIYPADTGNAGGQPEESREEMLFMHTFEWDHAEFAASYVLILEQQRGNAFVEVLRRNVEVTSLRISIPSGRYRYRVLSFNILGRLDTASDWVYINIIQALQPSIFGFTPENFYFDRQALRIIELDGVNLLMDSEIYLLRRKGRAAPEGESTEPPNAEDIILPKEVRRTELGESAQLVFDEESLVEGVYDIIVMNPGGLEAQAGPFGISVAKPYDLNLSAGYFPLVRMFSSSAYVISQRAVPLGFGASFSFVPFKKDFGFFGIELNPFWAYWESETGDVRSPVSRSSLLSAQVNMLYQYWSKKNILAINARLGIGISGLLGYQLEYHTGKNSAPENFVFFSWGGGVSAQWFFFKRLFAEAGINYFHIHDSNLPMGFLRFTVSGGWQF
ncbi:MAG: hypothetical protein LBD48_02280 [Treponema sp.]|jgi:hypothetical protein|nr:hypothetical protein [Treponema sp.]